MKIVEPSVTVFFHVPKSPDGKLIEPLVFLERVGRVCYKSEYKITKDSAPKFIKMLQDRGHHAMLEHCIATVHFVCDKGISHQLVRHRIASFAQENTKHIIYDTNKEISVIKPPFKCNSVQYDSTYVWERAMREAERAYQSLLDNGEDPQLARSVLPTCVKTELWETGNFREWIHIFELRCSAHAHPQMRELMQQVQKIFSDNIQELFK